MFDKIMIWSLKSQFNLLNCAFSKYIYIFVAIKSYQHSLNTIVSIYQKKKKKKRKKKKKKSINKILKIFKDSDTNIFTNSVKFGPTFKT
jgi:hypothetical protein